MADGRHIENGWPITQQPIVRFQFNVARAGSFSHISATWQIPRSSERISCSIWFELNHFRCWFFCWTTDYAEEFRGQKFRFYDVLSTQCRSPCTLCRTLYIVYISNLLHFALAFARFCLFVLFVFFVRFHICVVITWVASKDRLRFLRQPAVCCCILFLCLQFVLLAKVELS